ncbi:MAG: radical SAM protein [Chloroflexi bacterium]|nr:radical SAM protein [Chloroflexota bacterium]
MRYVFGPVPSRRLGRSLGIDTVPLKTCNWNCVYCQLGRTAPLVGQRREYYPRKDILAETQAALAALKPGEIDWVTFVGSGEPTLHSHLGALIHEVKSLTDLPVAVITNGALLFRPEVRVALSAADAVLPSLDAGSAELYRSINRPWPRLTFETLIEGLIAFRQTYRGKLWVEIMLVRGLNTTEEALGEIAAALRRIRPDRVDLNVPTRPPAETWVQAPSETELAMALAVLGDVAQVVRPIHSGLVLSGHGDVVDSILAIITRHPMSEQELTRALERWMPCQVEQALAALAESGRAQVVERYGLRFWSAVACIYPN